MNIFYVNVVYSKAITYREVKKKSKAFFRDSEFRCRNYVFTHPEKDLTLHLEKHSIHIAMSNDFSTQRLINTYLLDVFGNTFIDVDMPKDKTGTVLESLNYALV